MGRSHQADGPFDHTGCGGLQPGTDPQSKHYVSAVEAAAPWLGVEVMAAPVHSTGELEAMLARVAHEPNIGLIFSTGAFLSVRAKLIVETVARYRLPAIYADEPFTAEGGLMHYINDRLEPFRLAPYYVD